MEDITRHIVAAGTINWEMEYGSTTCNLEMGSRAMTPATDDEGDPLKTLGVEPSSSYHSPYFQCNNSFCFSVSPNDREFMDIHRMKYIKRMGGAVVGIGTRIGKCVSSRKGTP
jgi:hypothetical protein